MRCSPPPSPALPPTGPSWPTESSLSGGRRSEEREHQPSDLKSNSLPNTRVISLCTGEYPRGPDGARRSSSSPTILRFRPMVIGTRLTPSTEWKSRPIPAHSSPATSACSALRPSSTSPPAQPVSSSQQRPVQQMQATEVVRYRPR